MEEMDAWSTGQKGSAVDRTWGATPGRAGGVFRETWPSQGWQGLCCPISHQHEPQHRGQLWGLPKAPPEVPAGAWAPSSHGCPCEPHGPPSPIPVVVPGSLNLNPHLWPAPSPPGSGSALLLCINPCLGASVFGISPGSPPLGSVSNAYKGLSPDC